MQKDLEALPDILQDFRGDDEMSEQERKTKTAELADLKEQLKTVHGRPCEVYSRVVGYLRPVQNWNKGKKEEFAMRKTMNVSCC